MMRLAVAAALHTQADRQPERVIEVARRVAEEFPDNVSARVGLAVMATGIDTEGLEDPAVAARAALEAVDDVDAELAPCVYTVCGEILLHEGAPQEAAEALREAIEAPGIAPEWQARAEAALTAAQGPAAQTEQADQPDEVPADEPGAEAEGEG